MKKYIVFILLYVVATTYLSAQEKIVIYKASTVKYESEVSAIDSIKFILSNSVIHQQTGITQIPIEQIDSIIFEYEAITPIEQTIRITYSGNEVSVTNPLADQGVVITYDKAHVAVASTSTISNIEYILSGSTDSGSFTISSEQPFIATLSTLTLTNPIGAAINSTSSVAATLRISGTNRLNDGSGSDKNATILSKEALTFKGTGTLNLKGIKKHAISCDKSITVKGGSILISESASDGFHSESFVMDGGLLEIQAKGDGIDAGTGTTTVNNGTITIVSTTNDVKGMKGDNGLVINGGTINITVSGAQSKGMSTKKDAVFNGGDITITASGATVLTALGSGYDPSYCTAIKADGSIIVNDGTFHIESKSTSDGGKGFSADGNVIIYNGNITVTTAGDGKTFTNELGVIDSYTACCIKSDVDISLLGGTITCTSTGKGGKGISADSALVIGYLGANDADLVMNVTTSGEHFLVSGTGQTADYASPKAIKSVGNLTVNSGTIAISCTQTGEGGEGLESKDTLRIKGGGIKISSYDDCINAANHIEIAGGNLYLVARGNDGVDCNGTLTISGGFIISNGTRAPEEGFDCDNNRFAITGSTTIGTGGATSNPTVSACTQYSIKYISGTPGNSICIKNSAGETILLYTLPTYTSGSGGGNTMTLLFTDPAFKTGQHTLQYGGTISGGTTTNGYNVGGTYSGGSSKSFNITSMLTTVN